MSKSRHPVALRLEQHATGSTRLLATVMGLPLIDGIFAALVLAGILNTVGGLLQVGLLIFGGSATVAVILADIDGNPRDYLGAISLLGVGLIVIAAIEAALAPTIASVIDLPIFERFAALVILAVAAKTASARVGEYLPRPAVIIALGFIASLDPHGAVLVVNPDSALMLRAAAAAGIGVAFALTVAALGPTLREFVHLDRFRFGSAVALGTLPLGMLGVIPGNTPLAVLALTGILAFDPHHAPSANTPTTTAQSPAARRADAQRDDAADDRAPWL